MSLALVACLALSHSPVAEPHVSITKTENVAALLRDLAAQTGVRLEAGVRKADEILIVSMNDVSLSDAMKQIAWATYCRWEKLGSGFRLVPDSESALVAEREYVRWQTREAATAISRYEKTFQEANSGRAGAVKVLTPDGPSHFSPSDYALSEAISEVRPEDTIFLHADEPCFYDTEPGPSHHQLSAKVLTAFNDLSRGTDVGLATRAILTCDYRFETGTASLQLFDHRGFQCGKAKTTFRLYENPLERPREFADEVPDEVVPLSEASKFYVRAETRLPPGTYGVGPNDDVRGKIDDIRERLRHPELYEPMATFATDVWRAVAKWKGRNLVANIDDVYMYPAWAANPPKLRQAFKTAGGYNAELQPGWLRARPSLASPPWRHRSNRAALGILAQSERETELRRFIAIAEYAGLGDVAPDPWESNQYLSWAGGPQPEIFRGWELARIYGTVPAPALRDLYAFIPLQIASLPISTRRAILALILKDQAASERWSDSYAPPLAKQPSVRFPFGLPDGELVARPVDDYYYFIRTKQSDGSYGYGRWEGRAMIRYIRSCERNHPEALKTFDIMEFREVGLMFEVVLGPEDRLQLGRFTMGAPTGDYTSWQNAPDDMKRRLAAAG